MRLFVACANTNKVWALDLPALTAREQVSVALFPNAPAGTTPNGARGLARRRDAGGRERRQQHRRARRHQDGGRQRRVEGFIPTGLVSDVRCCSAKDGKRLFVLNGKGLTGQANPRGPQAISPTRRRTSTADNCCRARCRSSTCQTRRALKAHTQRVYDVTPLHRRAEARAGRRQHAGRLADSASGSATSRRSSTCST